MFKDLHKIIKETPVLLVPTLEGYDRGKFRTAQGVAIQQMPNDKSMKCTIINYNCDDMAHTLMHESFHHYYPTAQERDIEIFTNFLWTEKNTYYKTLCQNKIVESCEKYKL